MWDSKHSEIMSEKQKTGKEPKRLPLKSTSFKANGKEYKIVDTMSIERWKHMEDFQELLALSLIHI